MCVRVTDGCLREWRVAINSCSIIQAALQPVLPSVGRSSRGGAGRNASNSTQVPASCAAVWRPHADSARTAVAGDDPQPRVATFYPLSRTPPPGPHPKSDPCPNSPNRNE